jgi:surfactin synthase thioesterase subunit
MDNKPNHTFLIYGHSLGGSIASRLIEKIESDKNLFLIK